MPMTRLRRSIASALAGFALVGGALSMAAPASGAVAGDTPPDLPGSLSTAAVTPGVGPVSVAIVIPLTVPPTVTGLLDAETLTTYTEAGGLLTRQLDAVVGSRIAIGLDPMIVASIRVLGTAAPESAVTFLERLQTVSNEVFLLAYADSDPAVTGGSNAGDALVPLGFGFAVDPADFGPAVTPTPTTAPGPTDVPDPAATEIPDDGPPPLPSTDDLLAWEATLPSIAWPAEGTLTSDDLLTLSGLGYADVLVAGSNASPVSTSLVDLGEIDGLVTDDEVTAAVRDASYAATPAAYQEAASRLASTLKDRAAADPGRTIVATLDRRWPFGTLRIPDVLTAIESAAASQVVSLSDVLAGPRGGAQLVDATEPAVDRLDVTSRLTEATRDEATFLAIAEDPALITEPRRLSLLGLSAAAWHADDPGWTTATDALLASSRATLDAVQIADGSDLLLLSDISTLRMQVSNALPVAVTVYVSVRPLRPILHIEDSLIEVTVEPDSTSTASVPVESIANGDVTVRAELRGANGRTLGDVRFVKVILQAGWETAGTLVAGSLVVLIFGVGLVRVILRRRREAAAGTTSGPADG